MLPPLLVPSQFRLCENKLIAQTERNGPQGSTGAESSSQRLNGLWFEAAIVYVEIMSNLTAAQGLDSCSVLHEIGERCHTFS